MDCVGYRTHLRIQRIRAVGSRAIGAVAVDPVALRIGQASVVYRDVWGEISAGIYHLLAIGVGRGRVALGNLPCCDGRLDRLNAFSEQGKGVSVCSRSIRGEGELACWMQRSGLSGRGRARIGNAL